MKVKPMTIPVNLTIKDYIGLGADLGLKAARLTSFAYCAIIILFLDIDFLIDYFQKPSEISHGLDFTFSSVLVILFIQLVLLGFMVFFAMVIGIAMGAILGLFYPVLKDHGMTHGFPLFGTVFCLALIVGLSYWYNSGLYVSSWDSLFTLFTIILPGLIFTACGAWVSYRLTQLTPPSPAQGAADASI